MESEFALDLRLSWVTKARLISIVTAEQSSTAGFVSPYSITYYISCMFLEDSGAALSLPVSTFWPNVQLLHLHICSRAFPASGVCFAECCCWLEVPGQITSR